ncbi:MAG: hypothetical protein V4546_11050 [Bacteroidota bacterium]
MENDNKKPQNGSANSSRGADVPKADSQNEKMEVKEGNPAQQRPNHGTDGGNNTSSSEDQLPSIDNKGPEGSDADSDQLMDKKDDQFKGSDADEDKAGKTSI